MDLFSSRTCKKHIELVCDIGSGSVGVAFVELGAGSSPSVLYSERIALSPLRMSSSVGMYSTMSKEFQVALSRALDHATAKNIKPTRVS